ncbi:hypothetical protein Tco_0716692 [Tanacetum coccineum]
MAPTTYVDADHADIMADVNAPIEQAPTVAPPTRTDEQILPRIRWVPIGKSNCYLDAEKSQSNPIYKIAVDILKHTNFFRATDGGYKCQLDEQWFNLTKDTLRDALQITPCKEPKGKYLGLLFDETHHLMTLEEQTATMLIGEVANKSRSKLLRALSSLGRGVCLIEGISLTEHGFGVLEAVMQGPIEEKAGGRGKGMVKRRTSAPTEPSGHDESSSLYVELGLTESDTESDEEMPPVVKSGDQDEGQAGPDPGIQDKGQAEPNPDDVAGENLKLTVDESVILEVPASSTGTLHKILHEPESMVSITIHQDTSAIPPMTSPVIDLVSRLDSPNVHQPLPTTATATHIGELEQHITDLVDVNQDLEERLDKHRSRLYRLENQDIPNQVRKVVDEIVTDAVDWAMQAPLRERKVTLWKLNGASGASGSSQSPPPPPSNNQGGQSTSTAAPRSSKTAASAEYTAWTTIDTIIKPSISPIPEELHMDDDTTADEQAYSSSGKDASALKSTYTSPPKNSLLAQIGDLWQAFMDCSKWKMHKFLRFKWTDAILGRKMCKPALSITKMKAAYYLDIGLEQMTSSKLTKPRWDAKGFEYKHDFTVIDSLRAVTFRDKYGVQMIMSQEILSGPKDEFWVLVMVLDEEDVDRASSLCFSKTGKKRLKTLTYLLESRRMLCWWKDREGDYRLLKKTDMRGSFLRWYRSNDPPGPEDLLQGQSSRVTWKSFILGQYIGCENHMVDADIEDKYHGKNPSDTLAQPSHSHSRSPQRILVSLLTEIN